ncbi:MAG: hypothetical protein AAGI11_13970 [Pseudomonadota bacterium]
MSQSQVQSLPQDKFLRMSINLLYRAFQEATRTQAKQLYRQIEEGRVVGLSQVRMEDESVMRVDLSADCSEYRGKLNFGAFKASVQTLISNLAKAVEEERELRVFSAEGDPNMILFGCSAVTVEQQQANVMALGADLSSSAGVVRLQLMYLDPVQFEEQGNKAGSEA